MAFNFRPTSRKEILDKNKTFSSQAADVFSFVRDTYGKDISVILNPITDFKEVKIPRIVEEQDNIATVKRKLSGIVNLTGMKIQFGNGSGVGGSKIDAKTTAMQENATRFVCEQFIEKGKYPTNSKIEKIYPDYDEDWHNTFTLQATTLKTYLTGAPGGIKG